MSKKYLKILIIVVSACILFTVFYQTMIKSLSVEQIVPKSLSPNNIKVSLIIQETKYETEVREGSTVFELMKKIKEENNDEKLFDFKYTENPSLGVFINEINGQVGGNDGYWIYYVNGIEAGVGISNYKVNNGDQISWKYEK